MRFLLATYLSAALFAVGRAQSTTAACVAGGSPSTVTVTIPGGCQCDVATTTVTEVRTTTIAGECDVATTTITEVRTTTVPGSDSISTITVTAPGESSYSTVTVTAPGEGSVYTTTLKEVITTTVPGDESVSTTTVTKLITTTLHGDNSVSTTIVTATLVVSETAMATRTISSIETGTVANTITTPFISGVTATITQGTTVSLTEVVTTTIVTCASRTVNPTYTPAAPLPSDYLWGCPPGNICRPPQQGCNWEQNPPASTYVCNPDQCIPVAEAPVPEQWNATWPNPVDTNCAWYDPAPDYFHLNPKFFGLGFDVFDVNGQPICPNGTFSTTETATSTALLRMPRRRINNPVAEMYWRRQSLAVAPAVCYVVFDSAQQLGQSIGKVRDRLCPATSEFMLGISACRACAAANGATSSTTEDFPILQTFVNFCNT